MTSKKALCSLLLLALSLAPTALAQDNPGVCPKDDGQYRTTSAGTYLITCNKRAIRGKISEEKKATFADCIDAWCDMTSALELTRTDNLSQCCQSKLQRC